jgi:hypothetical protein
MPISARDRKRMSAHKNAELSHKISQYDTVFSATPNMTLAQMFSSSFNASVAVAFVIFLAFYLILFLVFLQGSLNFAIVAWASLLSLVSGYISEAYLNRGATSYSSIKAVFVSMMETFMVFLVLASLYAAYVFIRGTSHVTYAGVMIVIAFAIFYFTVKYGISTTARFRATRQQQINSFDASWRLLDNSFWGFLVFKLLFNIVILALVLAAITYDNITVSIILSIVLALVTAVYQVGKKGIFEYLVAKTGYYNPQV